MLAIESETIQIPLPDMHSPLSGILSYPPQPQAIVIFAHGSGSSRHSPRNQYVASVLQQAGLATLLIDLLTQGEEDIDFLTSQFRFDINLLAKRLIHATEWLQLFARTAHLPIGYFGASTGAAAALIASTVLVETVQAVVSRGGRPDLALPILDKVKAPTLLIVGERDHSVIKLNETALARLTGTKKLVIVPGATHLFEEPGCLEVVAQHACKWFGHYLVKVSSQLY